MRALAQSQEDEAVPHPDEGLILDIDGVAAAHREGGISQSSQVLAKLTGIVQSPGQTLVSTYVVNPQSIAAGNTYHLTVPPRYVELGEMRQAINLSGTYGKGALAARDAYMHRFYPEIDDNDWNDQSQEIALQTNFADYSMARRLTLIKQQEEAEGNETSCPLFTWAWSDGRGRMHTADPRHTSKYQPQGHDSSFADHTTRTVYGTSQTTRSHPEETQACS